MAAPEYLPDEQFSDCVPAAEATMEQLRSVDELSDVTPDDWAYQALQQLIERYGIPSGFPDGTFRGNQPMTRAEFAGAMAQLFANLEQLVATGKLTPLQEDILTLRRLQASYGAIAQTLDSRLTALDGLVTRMEAHQFSTTTKLSGQVAVAYTDGNNARGIPVSRVRLNLTTAFGPNQLLVTQLEAGNGSVDAVARAHNRSGRNALGTSGFLADGGGLDFAQVPEDAQLRKLYYSFKPLENLSVAVGPRLSPRDFVDQNRFANDSGENFSSSFFANNPLTMQNAVDRPGGAGVAVVWQPSKALVVRGVYAAADGDRPNRTAMSEGGLLGDRHQATVEAEYALRPDITLRGQLTHAKVNGSTITAVGLNGEWAVNKNLGVFGRFALGSYDGFNTALQRELDATPFSWAVGATLRDFLIPGTTAGLALGQPFVSGALGDATQTNFEGFYKLLLNDNISFTPGLILVASPNNESARGTIWQWFVRIMYTF
jgi:Carbohydrate-selective porin, OprB family/S-layer homology domain